MSNPWEDYPEIWKTQSAFMSYVRGGVRLGLWNKHPVKLQFIKDNRERAPIGRKTQKAPDGQEVWACRCYLCSRVFKQAECEVDHINGGHSLKSMDDLQKFVQAMLFVTDKDLRIVCKPCHKIKSYAERMGISYDEAVIEKKIIAFGNLPIQEQKDILWDYFVDVDDSNEKKRKEAYREILEDEE